MINEKKLSYRIGLFFKPHFPKQESKQKSTKLGELNAVQIALDLEVQGLFIDRGEFRPFEATPFVSKFEMKTIKNFGTIEYIAILQTDGVANIYDVKELIVL